jgi:hypothetical protein
VKRSGIERGRRRRDATKPSAGFLGTRTAADEQPRCAVKIRASDDQR